MTHASSQRDDSVLPAVDTGHGAIEQGIVSLWWEGLCVLGDGGVVPAVSILVYLGKCTFWTVRVPHGIQSRPGLHLGRCCGTF